MRTGVSNQSSPLACFRPKPLFSFGFKVPLKNEKSEGVKSSPAKQLSRTNLARGKEEGERERGRARGHLESLKNGLTLSERERRKGSKERREEVAQIQLSEFFFQQFDTVKRRGERSFKFGLSAAFEPSPSSSRPPGTGKKGRKEHNCKLTTAPWGGAERRKGNLFFVARKGVTA